MPTPGAQRTRFAVAGTPRPRSAGGPSVCRFRFRERRRARQSAGLRYPTGPFLLHEIVTSPTPGIVIVQPCAADPGAASFGVCVCRSVWPSDESKSFRPLNAQIEACPLVTAAVLFVESPMQPGTGGP